MNQSLDCRVYYDSKRHAEPPAGCGQRVDLAAQPQAACRLAGLGISPESDLPALLLTEPDGRIRIAGVRLTGEEATKLAEKLMKLNPNVEMGSQSEYEGDGSVKRNEKLTLRIAATVVQVLPNGQLVIQGDQEVRVNYELRDLQITGIVRPEDISRYNEVAYDRIAGARIRPPRAPGRRCSRRSPGRCSASSGVGPGGRGRARSPGRTPDRAPRDAGWAGSGPAGRRADT